MLVYGECECFIMQMLYVCVLCASCGSSQCCVKSLVLSRLDYGSQLWSPHLVKHIDQLEKIQRSFTKHITRLHGLEYSKRLVSLKLYSLQRRRERYCIIYVWKIIEGLVPNFSKPIVCSYSERRGRSCIVSHVHLGRLGSLAYNSFRWRAIRLFNAMPKYIRLFPLVLFLEDLASRVNLIVI